MNQCLGNDGLITLISVLINECYKLVFPIEPSSRWLDTSRFPRTQFGKGHDTLRGNSKNPGSGLVRPLLDTGVICCLDPAFTQGVCVSVCLCDVCICMCDAYVVCCVCVYLCIGVGVCQMRKDYHTLKAVVCILSPWVNSQKGFSVPPKKKQWYE